MNEKPKFRFRNKKNCPPPRVSEAEVWQGDTLVARVEEREHNDHYYWIATRVIVEEYREALMSFLEKHSS